MAYYIIEAAGESGPHDMLAMVRRRKNGTLLPTTSVRLENGETKPAHAFAELASLFEEEPPAPIAPKQPSHYVLRESLLQGWQFIQRNHNAVMITGLYLLATTLIALVLDVLGYAGNMLGFVGAVVAYGAYALCILRLTRGQRIEKDDIINTLKTTAMPLALMALTLIVPLAVGMFLLIAPGLLLITLYLFTPLLIVEKNLGFWDAMEASRKKTMGFGANNFSVLFATVVINFFAALCFMVPLLISLPLTTAIIAEIYEKEFGE
jgi:hypothetical protein